MNKSTLTHVNCVSLFEEKCGNALVECLGFFFIKKSRDTTYMRSKLPPILLASIRILGFLPSLLSYNDLLREVPMISVLVCVGAFNVDDTRVFGPRGYHS